MPKKNVTKVETNLEKAKIANMKFRSGELMKSGKMAAAIKLYNRAWNKERKMKGAKGT